MDEEQIKQAEELVELFVGRDIMLQQANIAIFEFLRDPILNHLATFFRCAIDDIEWTTVELDVPVVIITCTLHYPTAQTIPEFMNKLAPPDDDDFLNRSIKIRVPIALMFATSSQAQQFLTQLTGAAIDMASKQPTSSPSTSASSTLTDEQQLLVFHLQKQNKGTLH